ncbi:MAG: PadR family transcriptional regulator, partial [Nanoarchaeota archaeon]|nr:PadR family transcriptional regulator [Nanoarchaeota archaeon]
LRIITLKAMQEGPKTGYDIIKYIGEKTSKKPSYGSIYPLLEQLKKEGLIEAKEEKRRKIHSLTKKGREEIKHLTNQKNELLEKLEEGICIFATIADTKSVKLELEFIKKMKREELTSMDLMPEMDDLKKTILELVLKNPNKTQKKEIIKIIKRTTKELEAVK